MAFTGIDFNKTTGTNSIDNLLDRWGRGFVAPAVTGLLVHEFAGNPKGAFGFMPGLKLNSKLGWIKL